MSFAYRHALYELVSDFEFIKSLSFANHGCLSL
jgi:hypothetical protein